MYYQDGEVEMFDEAEFPNPAAWGDLDWLSEEKYNLDERRNIIICQRKKRKAKSKKKKKAKSKKKKRKIVRMWSPDQVFYVMTVVIVLLSCFYFLTLIPH